MLNQDQINHFNSNGEVYIKKFLDKINLKKVKNEFNYFVNKKLKNLQIGKDYMVSKNQKLPTSLHRLEKHKKSFFFKIANDKKILKMASKLIGSKAKLYSMQFFMKNHKDNHPTPIHQDNAYWCYKNGKGISFWIALNKVNKKNGGMYYFQKTHKKNFSHIPSKIPGSSLIIKKISTKYKKVNYDLNPGDMVAHDSKTIHGSFSNIDKKNRIGFILCYVSMNSKMDLKLRSQYEKKLFNIHKKN